jgi:hypothetical protein
MCAFLPNPRTNQERPLRVDLTGSPHCLATTAICAFETFERRLESTLSYPFANRGRWTSRLWTGSAVALTCDGRFATHVVVQVRQARSRKRQQSNLPLENCTQGLVRLRQELGELAVVVVQPPYIAASERSGELLHRTR